MRNEAHIAWIAGLFEGEGYIGLRRGTSPELQLTSVDQDVIERLVEWSGMGNVADYELPSGKTAYRWSVSRRDDAGRLLEMMFPYLSNRRRVRAKEVIEIWKMRPTRGTSPTCGYGHQLSGDNLRLVDGRRRCLKCAARRQREHRARKAA